MEMYTHLEILRKCSLILTAIYILFCMLETLLIFQGVICVSASDHVLFKAKSDIARHFLCSPEYPSPALHTYRMLEMAVISSPQLLMLGRFF